METRVGQCNLSQNEEGQTHQGECAMLHQGSSLNEECAVR